MHEICYKLKLLIFFLNFDLAKEGSALLASPGCTLGQKTFLATLSKSFKKS